jgi:DNA-binding transcriptional MocR family regulator
MSIDAMSWAFKQDLPPAEKLVLLSLADHHNSGTGKCIPSQASVAEQTSMSVRTVQRHMASLEERGLIRRVPRFRGEGRGRTSDAYILQGDNLARWLQGDKPGTTKATIQDDQGDTRVVGTGREPEENPIAAKPRERQPDILFDAVAKTCAINTDKLTASARGALNRAVKELRDVNATPDQITAVAKSYRNQYPNATLTPMALVKHWSAFVRPDTPNRPSVWDTYERPEWY